MALAVMPTSAPAGTSLSSLGSRPEGRRPLTPQRHASASPAESVEGRHHQPDGPVSAQARCGLVGGGDNRGQPHQEESHSRRVRVKRAVWVMMMMMLR
jgi:hypothetical protein